MYDNYVFDLYGTLIDVSTNEHKEELWTKMAELINFHKGECNPLSLKKQYFDTCEALLKRSSNTGKVLYPEIKMEKVFTKLVEFNCGTKLTPSQSILILQFFRILATDYIKLYNGADRLLTMLKNFGKKIYLLSNAQRGFTIGEMDMLGITKYFDGIILSSDVGCIKPDKRIYEALISTYNIDGKKTLFIGNDWFSDIYGAGQYGFDTVYFHSNISPEVKGELNTTYKIADGDYNKLIDVIAGTIKSKDNNPDFEGNIYF
ncbi:MAG: HAD family hydrolase [Clostridia bacterium]|nr:HAD family hydrolase [Clostridia bacterium]